MRLRSGSRRHSHQADDHAVALDAGAIRGRIVGPAENVVHLGEFEQVLAGRARLAPGVRAAAV